MNAIKSLELKEKNIGKISYLLKSGKWVYLDDMIITNGPFYRGKSHCKTRGKNEVA